MSEDENIICQNEDTESDKMVSDMMSVDVSNDDNEWVDSDSDSPDADQTAGGDVGEDNTQHMECLVFDDSQRTKCDYKINGRSIRDRTAECKESIDRTSIKPSKDEHICPIVKEQQ